MLGAHVLVVKPFGLVSCERQNRSDPFGEIVAVKGQYDPPKTIMYPFGSRTSNSQSP